MNRLLLIIYSLCLPLGLGNDCAAQFNEQSPEWLRRVVAGAPGPYQKIRPMAAEYALTWKGRIPAGKMQFTLKETEMGVLESKASGKSIGMARVLFPYDFSGTASTSRESLRPIAFQFQDQLKNRGHKYTLQFEPERMISLTDVTDRKTKVVTPYRQVYRFHRDCCLDLMSSILYLRSLPLNKGEKVSLITTTFNRPYLTEYEVLGREKKRLRRSRKTFNAIKLDLRIKRIHQDLTTEPYDKIERATVWVSDDEFRIPIEFQGDIFIGYISAQMTHRRWLTNVEPN